MDFGILSQSFILYRSAGAECEWGSLTGPLWSSSVPLDTTILSEVFYVLFETLFTWLVDFIRRSK